MNNILNKIFFTLSLLSFLLFVRQPCAADGKAGAKEFSLIAYSPRASEYPAELQALVEQIEKADSALGAGKKLDSALILEAALKQSKVLDNQIDRAFLDQIFFLRGFILEKLKRESEALTAYATSLKLKPSNLLALFMHAALLKKLNRCEIALGEFKEIKWQVDKLKSDNLSGEMDFLIAQCLIASNKAEEGQKLLASSYKKNPHFLPVIKENIKINTASLASINEPSRATSVKNELIGNLRELLRQDPEDEAASLQLAKLLMENDNSQYRAQELSEASKYLVKLVEQSNYSKPELVRLLVQVKSRQDELGEAERILNKGLASKPNSAELLEAKKQVELDKELKEEQGQ